MISVVIPAYNREKSIKKSIESVLNQTYSDIEVIVVDDGSTDNTKKEIEQIKDKRLKYVYQKNQGACAARNKGISKAKGEFIALHDSDDEWVPNKLEIQLKELKDSNSDLISCGMKKNTNSKYKVVYLDYEINLENMLKYNVMSTQTLLMKREVCENVKFDVTFKRLQDWDFVLSVLLSGYKISYVNEPLVITNDSYNSITSSVKAELAYNHLIDKYKKYYEKYPKSLAYIYMLIARDARKRDRNVSHMYLIKSLKKEFSVKTIIKILLNKLKMWN